MTERSRRHSFEIEGADAPDALVRRLGPFIVRGVRIISIRHDAFGSFSRTVLSTEDLGPEAAEWLRARIRQMPQVSDVRLTISGEVGCRDFDDSRPFDRGASS
jgi:hypothetical protein